MHSEESAEADRALEALGPVPSDLFSLIELYAGSARLAVSDADLLLARLGGRDRVIIASLSYADKVGEKHAGVGADRFENTLAGAAVAIGDQVALTVDQVALTVDQVENRNLVEYGDGDRVELSEPEQRLAHPAPSAHVSAEDPVATVLTRSAEVPEPRDGPLTRRMDARDVRLGARGRKSTLSGGLLGADDLPEFPLTRGPSTKNNDDAKPAIVNNTSAATDDDADSFEILVDEEILEIEPDDALFEDSPEEH